MQYETSIEPMTKTYYYIIIKTRLICMHQYVSHSTYLYIQTGE